MYCTDFLISIRYNPSLQIPLIVGPRDKMARFKFTVNSYANTLEVYTMNYVSGCVVLLLYLYHELTSYSTLIKERRVNQYGF